MVREPLDKEIELFAQINAPCADAKESPTLQVQTCLRLLPQSTFNLFDRRPTCSNSLVRAFSMANRSDDSEIGGGGKPCVDPPSPSSLKQSFALKESQHTLEIEPIEASQSSMPAQSWPSDDNEESASDSDEENYRS